LKNNKYHTVGTITKSNIKIVERGKIDIRTQKYITDHFPDLVQAFHYKVAVLN